MTELIHVANVVIDAKDGKTVHAAYYTRDDLSIRGVPLADVQPATLYPACPDHHQDRVIGFVIARSGWIVGDDGTIIRQMQDLHVLNGSRRNIGAAMAMRAATAMRLPTEIDTVAGKISFDVDIHAVFTCYHRAPLANA